MIGLGSIGTRHLHNIASVLRERNAEFTIDWIRSDPHKFLDAKTQQLINEVFSYDEVSDDYDVIFIANPTHLHFKTIKKYASKTKHMFIEKPIFDDINAPLDKLALNDDGVYYVACPLRYTGVIQHIKKNLCKERVYSVRVICSSYLPDWRPNVDYRHTYSAHKNQGGGVSIDLIHEWDYLSYLFGYPEEIYNIRGIFSKLEIDSDDLSIYIARYKDKAVEVHLDYFGRKSIREIQLFTKGETIVGDLIKSEIRYLSNNKVIGFKESRNDYQRKEITYFFDILDGKESNYNNILTAVKTLKIAKGGSL